jgi:hypothetical protein
VGEFRLAVSEILKEGNDRQSSRGVRRLSWDNGDRTGGSDEIARRMRRSLLPNCLDKEEHAMERTVNNPISPEELACMAIKLRNDLFDYEDKLGSCRDFRELKLLTRWSLQS